MTRDAGKHVSDRRPVLRTPSDVGQRRAERKAHTAQDAAGAAQIDADEALFEAQFGGVAADRILAGTIDVNEYIEGNFTAGSSGWRIDGDGSAEFNDVTVRGTVTASVITSSSISGSDIVGGTITGEITITVDDGTGPYIVLDGTGWGTDCFIAFPSRNGSESQSARIVETSGGETRIVPTQWGTSADGYLSLQNGVGGTNNTRLTLETPSGSGDMYIGAQRVAVASEIPSGAYVTSSEGPPGGLTNTVSGGSYTSGTTSGASAGTAHTHTYDRNHTHSVGSHTHTVSI